MSENGTQGTPSGENQDGAGAPAPGNSGAGATGASGADSFATERAHLEQQRASWQGRADKAEKELAELKAAQPQPPAPTATTPPAQVDVGAIVREELRRRDSITSTVGALREQFPYATGVLDASDSFDNVEQLRVAAENEHKRVEALIGPALTAAAEAAAKPYVERFGALQAPPAGAAPGEGQGLPTLAEVNAMSLDEQTELEKQHPGHVARLHREALT